MSENIQKMQNVKSIREVNLKDKRVLIRVDFNVPMDSELNISDDTRIREAIPTINYCIDNGAKSIILVSHLGRPQGKSDSFSLKNILKRLERLLSKDVVFVDSLENAQVTLNTLVDGSIVLLENIRFYEGEEKNDSALSQKLASLCDVYVNDAFGTSHRKHASTYGIAQYAQEKVAGLLLKKEIDSFAVALSNPLRPLLLIVGGSKVSSKLTLLNSILNVVDKIIIGGAMSNTFLKAIGYDTKASLTEDNLLEDARSILRSAKEKGVKIYLPVDVVATDDIKDPKVVKIIPAQDIPDNLMAADIGPATVKLFNEVIKDCETIVWNGPLGAYETQKFSRGTFSISHAIADTYAYSIIGGGDTADAVDKAGNKDSMSFTSTGGGASLELLEGEVLPAFEVLDKRV
ncbi:phosphoglycerate kinase [Helicobacter winghamensis]|uniref:Phosphoglycerate kinase n=1 Tax=Helicobacter winghamensis TaxID=157268 RepID=A0A2N3PJ07_9HELI|nr:phosphoglycerate kinase [Helicobacter winghamensis]EEO25497.1 phosphoglycerate kinase [Helicobacter winghamensis ATCC BAA-430]PKT78080.1 phosphoglycerate kinase [Helicobacter winghamensis]PKT78345.1 phosphoglycerate kinase [Helicobacter winghamensis]PKT78608.1 phosphoglycerate kinase [Helicobacter winghamensis]PKT81029.1 phosphoglycerate kinase [Helicobacter winghamensis]